MAESSFDPRFDPAFQRGYEPTVTQRTPPPQAPAQTTQISPPPVAVTDSEPSEEAKEPLSAKDIAPLPRRVNPYVVVLWVLGVLFSVGGVVLLFASFFLVYSSYATGPSPSQAATLQAIYIFGSVFGAPLVTVGLATIAGLIFVSAWRSWQRSGASRS